MLGSSWVEKTFVGVRAGEWTQNGFFDDGANSVNAGPRGRGCLRPRF